ncbi:hypothetical protein PRZ48_010780 [Zasmidium cellare]|uniref:RTA1 like protein n=1 Tax=Zasmidium cellare TaxID=395010 RepID=A0ABR0E9M9_ZASCE|nr:hypothetical protein PRZ48_010780 [Zasmidium cellare]
MLLSRADDGGLSNFKYYYYTPTMAGAVIFILLFLVTTIIHFYQMIRTRTWFMVPFCIGGLFEVIGYIGRALSSNEAPDFTLGPYIIQSIFLLVAPALFAASIYMELARIVLMVEGDQALFIRRRWLTRIFVTGDILSFFMQSGGGGLLAKGGDSINTGESLIMGGLALQLVFFFLFVVAGAIFHARVRGNPTEKCKRYPYEKHLWNLYIVSVMIFVRCLVRLVEYGQGWDGYIITHEAFLYIFDALLMWLAMLAMFFPHPSEVAAIIRGHGVYAVNVIFTRDM